MKQALEQFLQQETSVQYKSFKARIISLNPTRLTEDNKESLEVPDFLSAEEAEKYRAKPSNNSEVAVEEWRFETTAHPAPQGYIVKFVPIKYTLGKPSSKAKPKASLPSMLDSKVLA